MNLELKEEIKNLARDPGIYQFYDDQNILLYIGKSVSIKKRVTSYFANKNLGPKTNQLVSKIAKVKYIKVFSEFEALLLEADLIRTYKPFYNIQAKDDKSPIYITITKEEVPLINVVRKKNLEYSKNLFIKGPFPSATTTKEILKTIRKIFPYCSHKNPKKPCLYAHLGLCPYPYGSDQAKEEYKKTITNIKKLLSGKKTQLMRDLTAQMQSFAKENMFEQASEIKNQLQKLEYLVTTYRDPIEFLHRPSLVDDLSLTRLKDIKEKLNLEKVPTRIECYDISNISGKFATGSMVVFINGKSDKSQYRRFKIKVLDTPNDFEMMKQVLARRFKNSWPKPNLIIIDGGKGQLSAALEVAKKYNQTMPIVSLAKRLEEIYTSPKEDPISLPKESPARQLAQAIRDEAHRFAITYHRHLRSKNFIAKL